MDTLNFTTSTVVDASPEQAFDAINNVRGWWSECIRGTTDKINSEFSHRDKNLYVTFKITQLSSKEIVWNVVSSHLNLSIDNLHEWDNTKIVFEISESANKTKIKFTHVGLTPKIECHDVCSNAWNRFITTSLKNFIKTGKGDPISSDYESFNTSITVDESPEDVYKSVNNVRGWWLNNIEGKTNKLNEEFKFYEDEILEFHFRIIEMVPNEKIVWLVVNQNFKNTEKQEWKGSTLIYEISKVENKTQLKFTHQGLIPQLDCYETCEKAWTNYIQESLFNFIRKGKGQPNKW